MRLRQQSEKSRSKTRPTLKPTFDMTFGPRYLRGCSSCRTPPTRLPLQGQVSQYMAFTQDHSYHSLSRNAKYPMVGYFIPSGPMGHYQQGSCQGDTLQKPYVPGMYSSLKLPPSIGPDSALSTARSLDSPPEAPFNR